MAKVKKTYVCSNCGHVSAQWLGQCPACKHWNSFEEEVPVVAVDLKGQARPAVAGGEAMLLSSVSTEEGERLHTGISELDRVLGGGLVKGSLILLAGDPGIGKSTLTMQLCAQIRVSGAVLYISGEESKGQIRNRAERLKTLDANIHLLTETDLSKIDAAIRRMRPALIVLDSIQTVYDGAVSSAPGSVTQLRQVATFALNWAKGLGIATVLIGHVTKEGAVAGPRVLEHMVDAVLYFEGDRQSNHRMLRAFKNRFGSTNEIGIFDMQSDGLVAVENPSALFLSERGDAVPGSSVTAVVEGCRPILVEVQALVAPTVFAKPYRSATGADYSRLSMLLAVLEKRLGLRLGNQDVYVNIAGGLDVDAPSADLAIAMAILSAYHDRPLPEDMVFLGEIGLTGEVRRVPQLDRALEEAKHLGFGRALVPAQHNANTSGMTLLGIKQLTEAVHILGGHA